MEATLPKIDRNIPPPAVLDERWIPEESGWPELDEFRAEHVRLRQASAAAATARRELEEQFEAEDKDRHTAYREAVASGTEPKLPRSTNQQKREDALRDASAQAKAAYAALCDQVDQVLAFMSANGFELLERLDA